MNASVTRRRPHLPPALRDERGMTLVELLVAMSVMIVVVAAVVDLVGVATRHQERVGARAEAITRGQVGLERMTHELRQASWVLVSSSQVVDFDALVPPGDGGTPVHRHVRYDCSGASSCTRLEGPPVQYPPDPDAPLPQTATLIEGVRPADVFTPWRTDRATGTSQVDPLDADYLAIRIKLDVAGMTKPVTLEDGVSLRNRIFAR